MPDGDDVLLNINLVYINTCKVAARMPSLCRESRVWLTIKRQRKSCGDGRRKLKVYQVLSRSERVVKLVEEVW